MKNKRESERLSKMFSGIEVLAVNPALDSLEIQPESEIPSVQIAEPEEASSEYEIGAFSRAADLSANPLQIEHQSTDVPIMVDNDSIEASSLNDRMEPIVESALPLPDLSNAIRPCLTYHSISDGATPNAHPRQ